LDANAIQGLQSLGKNNAQKLVKQVLTEKPELLSEIGKVIQGYSGDQAQMVQFLEKATQVRVNGAYPYSSDDLFKMAGTYRTLDTELNSVSTTTFEGVVHRAVKKEVEVGGIKIHQTEADVFNFHPGISPASNRIDLPGNQSLSTAIGLDAKNTILKEIKQTESELIFSEMHIRLNRVLDLTENSQTLPQLELTFRNVSTSTEHDIKAYFYTNILGNLSLLKGFDGILLTSAEHPNGINLYLLKPFRSTP
jgi:hypothetical protein